MARVEIQKLEDGESWDKEGKGSLSPFSMELTAATTYGEKKKSLSSLQVYF
jgi:hypothetical protein